MNTKSIIRLENKNLSQFHNAKAQTVVLFRPVEKKKKQPSNKTSVNKRLVSDALSYLPAQSTLKKKIIRKFKNMPKVLETERCL